MKANRYLEHLTLFLSIVKWTVYATIIGLVVGFSTSIFLKLIGYSGDVSKIRYFYFLMPVAFFLSSFAIMCLAPSSEGLSTDRVIEAVNKRYGKLGIKNSFVKLFATIITILSGGSAGRVGPNAKIGGGVASFFATIFKIPPEDRRKMVICGISAGFAAIFGTPIAAAIFAVEVLYLGRVFYNVLFPSFVAGIISYQTAKVFGIKYFYHSITAVPEFSVAFLLKIILGGIYFGIVAVVFIELFNFIREIFKHLKIWKPIKGIFGGLILSFTTLLVGTRYLGLGLGTIEQSLNGANFSIVDPLLKIIFTAITFGSGGSGGIITPIFFIGSTAGSYFAGLFNLNIGMFAAIGIVSILAGAANTPIAATILAIELFGPGIGVFAGVSCMVSFLIAGHRSIFSMQRIDISKTPSLIVESSEKEVGTVKHLHIKPRRRTLTWLVLKIGNAIFKFLKGAKRKHS